MKTTHSQGSRLCGDSIPRYTGGPRETSQLQGQVLRESRKRGLGTCRSGVDADPLACAPTFKLHHSLNKSEESVILAQADVETRKELRSPLTDDDRPSLDCFPAVSLDSEILGIAIPPVS